MPRTKRQLLAYLSKRSGISPKSVDVVLREFVSLAYKEAKTSFKIQGLGELVLTKRKLRTGLDIKHGEKIDIAARKVVKFRISKKNILLINDKIKADDDDDTGPGVTKISKRRK